MAAVKPSHGLCGRQPPAAAQHRGEHQALLRHDLDEAPPGRSSNARTSVVYSRGHHYCRNSSGSVQARHNAARGAANARLMTGSVSG